MAPHRLQYNIVYDLLEGSGKEKVDVVGIHVGTNSLLSTETPDEISHNIFEVATTCIDYGVQKVMISGIITRWNGIRVESKRMEVNNILKGLCDVSTDLTYICNDNIDLDDIENRRWDHVHLTREGESGSKRASNMARALNDC